MREHNGFRRALLIVCAISGAALAVPAQTLTPVPQADAERIGAAAEVAEGNASDFQFLRQNSTEGERGEVVTRGGQRFQGHGATGGWRSRATA